MDLLLEQPVLLAVAIFLARIVDVSIGTVRTILIIRGYRLSGAVLGFFEILIWVLAAAPVVTNLQVWYLVVAYAAGFATGNYVGSWIESRLALGAEIVRVISRDPAIRLKDVLRQASFGVVELAGRASDGAVEVLLVVEPRRRVPQLLRLVHETDARAVCSVSDARIPARMVSRAEDRSAIRGGWRAFAKRK